MSKWGWVVLVAGLMGVGCQSPVGDRDAACIARGITAAYAPGSMLVGQQSGSGVSWAAVPDECVGAWDRAGWKERVQ